MKKILICAVLLCLSNVTMAENAWDYDSCMENAMRQFTCTIDHQDIFIDLESHSTQLNFKAASDEKIYGIFVDNISGGQLYISCDHSDDLDSVQFKINGSSHSVHCKDE